ncbi:MBL fold hydrolase [Methanocella sp. CWC-04]|uniref:MBL fold hydrolase n=2 Tax=Methanooceanicella nereidis TaxID=2052831 RepID=A0AAP2RE64_9EURY|nr:MBL fold hydrolase [Methanocella sp. CWC-04]
MSEIVFLGTAGGRMVVTSQLRKSGGMWLELNGKRIVLDPGPGCLLRCVELGIDPAGIDCIVLSHKHIDHSNDVNIMIEAMSGGGFKPKGILIAPGDSLEGDDPVVLRYVRTYIKGNIKVLKESFRYSLGEVDIEAATKLEHSDVETYGLKFSFGGKTIGYIADTEYFDALPEAFKGCDYLIINMVRMTRVKMLQHLIPIDIINILKKARPGVAILNHFGMQVVKASPEAVAKKIEAESGVRTIAAGDGMRLDLGKVPERPKDMTLERFLG